MGKKKRQPPNVTEWLYALAALLTAVAMIIQALR
jgi:hypothetical protein